jgi:hypothetical protein
MNNEGTASSSLSSSTTTTTVTIPTLSSTLSFV